MKRSVGAKLAVLLLGIALVPAAIAFSLGGLVLRSSLESASESTLATADEAIVASLEREGRALAQAFAEQITNPLVADDFASMKRIAKNLLGVRHVQRAQVVDADGVLMADGSDTPALRRIESADRPPTGEVEVRQVDGALVVLRRLVAGERTIGFVVVALSTEPSVAAEAALVTAMNGRLAEGESRLLRTSLGTAAAMIVLVAIISALLARWLTRPIVALRDATERVGEGDLSVRVPVRSDDEIGVLGRSFNQMTEEIAASRDALRDTTRMQRELEIAAQIQTSLLPPAPNHPDLEFSGRMAPADEVGGDFYDVIRDPEGRALWITIGDVSSHGLGAGVVMLMAQSQFASMCAADPTMPPDQALRRVNRLLHENVQSRLRDDKYVTARLFAYQGGGLFRFAGGHEWPIVWRASARRCEQLDAEGPWLGILAELPDVPVGRVQLDPGDVLVLYTDGITETAGAGGKLFEPSGLMAAIDTALAAGSSLAAASDAVFAAVEAFGTQDDDRTLLLVRRRGSSIQPPARPGSKAGGSSPS